MHISKNSQLVYGRGSFMTASAHCLPHLSPLCRYTTHSSVPHTATAEMPFLWHCSTNGKLRIPVKDQSPSPAFSVNCWRNTSMASCTNTYTIIICYQIHKWGFHSGCSTVTALLSVTEDGSLPLNMAKKYVLCSLTIAKLLTVSPTCLC